MATKKKATAAKKTASKKPTIRGGSARSAARDADTGLPPAGALDDKAVDAAVLAWKTKQVKSKSDYVNYRIKTIIADAEEMVGGTIDLTAVPEDQSPHRRARLYLAAPAHRCPRARGRRCHRRRGHTADAFA